ncbi:unnamed protein product [Lepeophtheirus salmonis]|uniref:(salmon louse) hypothetical protein n=1 Tax=Lepeophtheirus salmonis TaxID=72036 RepID=A0A7R8CRA6_LEPSM|nr:unnamed protein product [Lepeophtheirus salmonis]CAF2903125.1 unnamed protein product [Lepeophtheirus salmonis]
MCGSDEKKLKELVKRGHEIHHRGIDITFHFTKQSVYEVQKNLVEKTIRQCDIYNYIYPTSKRIFKNVWRNFLEKKEDKETNDSVTAPVTATNMECITNIDRVPCFVTDIRGRDNEQMDQTKEVSQSVRPKRNNSGRFVLTDTLTRFIKEVFLTLERFNRDSGLKVNLEQTVILTSEKLTLKAKFPHLELSNI